MNTFRHLTVFSFSVFLLAAAAQAEPGHPRGPQDMDGDGVISRAEFDQWSNDLFAKLDANGDQVISEEEQPERRGRRGGPPPGFAGRILLNGADGNDDGAADTAEWQAFLATLEVGADGALTDEGLAALLPPRPRNVEGAEGDAPADHRVRMAGHLFDSDHDGAVTLADLNDLFAALDANADGILSDDELPKGGPGGRGRGGRGDRGGRGPGQGRFGS